MNLDNISAIAIPEGNVKAIHNVDNIMLWHRPKVYGVHWDGGSSAAMTRTDDSANFASPTIGTGTTSGSSPFDNCYPWCDMKIVNDGDNVLVAIPKFWYKWTANGSALSLQISDRQMPNFHVSPMHSDRVDGAGERDIAYIGKYKCASDYKSKAGYAPKASISIGTARTNIAKLGDGYYQQDYASFWTIRMLFLVEFATWDSQSVLQNTTNFDSLANIVTGGTSSMSYHTGVSANGLSVQYRYIEDPWENFLEWVDGLYFNGTSVYCINNPDRFAVGSNGIKIGTRSTGYGYIKSWTIPTVSGYEWALIPNEITDSESYICDGYYYVSTGTVVYIGGARSAWGVHGAFFIYTDFTASSESTVITSRLMKLPQNRLNKIAILEERAIIRPPPIFVQLNIF